MIESLLSKEVSEFILSNENEDISKLALSNSKNSDFPIRLALAQIQSRKKARSKLPEWYNTKGILFPHGVPIEQCSSERTAKYKAELISGRDLIDLTGGTGIDTYYLSQHFEKTQFVELQQELCDLAIHNFGRLNAQIEVQCYSAEEYLNDLSGNVDCIYLDPARRDQSNNKVFRIEDCSPNVLELKENLLKKSNQVMIKFSPFLDIKQTLRSLDKVKELHIISVDNECKELLVILSSSKEETSIKTINITSKGEQAFEYYLNEINESKAKYSEPEKYLYEPNSSLMKSGCFDLISEKFGINKLHPNSHLYTSDTRITDFPGRSFLINSNCALRQSEIKSILPEMKANIATRNFPMSVKDIRKKSKIKEGGNSYIFATTLLDGKARLLVCEKS